MPDNPKPPTARRWREHRHREAEQILRQFPDISETEFTLTWDLEVVPGALEERNWIIRHGGQIIYREPVHSEDYHRFELIARLLRQKYGGRIRDLVPVESNDVAYYLYGDFLGAVGRVEAARKRNFG